MSERGEIRRDGSKAVKNSGRGMQKGDSRLGPFTIDYKEYPKGYTISEGAWAKICTDAWRNGSTEPLLKLILGEGMDKTRLVVMSESMFNALRDRGWDDEV